MILNTPDFPNCESSEMLARNVPAAVIGAAMKETALMRIQQFSDAAIARVDPITASRLALYNVKEGIARNPDSASASEIAELELEAVARGGSLADLFGIIVAQAGVLRTAILKLDRVTVEAKVATVSLDGDPSALEVEIESLISNFQNGLEDALSAIAALASS